MELGPWRFFPTGADAEGFQASGQLLVRIAHASPVMPWFHDASVPAPGDPGHRPTADWFTDQSDDDEVASLLSLALGIRLRSGGMTRQLPCGPGADPAGVPAFHDHRPPMLAPITADRLQIQGLRGTEVQFAPALDILRLYPQLTPTEAFVCVKAAKHYADALWIADSDTELAWLHLVTAIEVVAEQEHMDTVDSVGLFEEKYQSAARIIRAAAGEDVLSQVAEEFRELNGPTQKFRQFVTTYAPGPPCSRPSKETERVDWTKLSAAMSRIYAFRSNFLHAGTPFPAGMVGLTLYPGDDGRIPECPETDSPYAAQQSEWKAGTVPMFLWVFAYLTRGSLLNWMEARAANNEQSTRTEATPLEGR